MMVREIITGAAALAAAGSVAAQPWSTDTLPPAPAWRGKSEQLVAKSGDPWITPSETTGLTATPDYAETRAWLERLDAASPLVRVMTFGKTAQGRDLLVVFVSKDPLDGAEPRLDPAKPVLLAQAGIHSGEIDGKDAGMMLLRDIALRGKDGLLDRANLLFIPMFNADGHERASRYSRPNQRGPETQGWRTNAQNLNLNRDYTKLDTAELRGLVGLIRRWDPALYLDLHVTDGMDYAYDITFGCEGCGADPARSPAIAAWLREAYTPAVNKALAAQGHIPGPLVFPVDDHDITKGLVLAAGQARFSNSYGDLVHTPSVLVENHSLKPYRQRVLGTYVLIEESLKALGRDGPAVRAAMAKDRAMRPAEIPARYAYSTEPKGRIEFLPLKSETYRSAASGRDELRWLGEAAKPITVPVFGSAPAATVAPPRAYWVPPTKPEVIARLRLHGIAVETLDAPRTVEVEMLRLKDPKPAAGPFEGHTALAIGGVVRERRRETFPAGSVRVASDQPLGQLAAILLEPESDDSFLAWGFFPEILQRTEYIEGYVMAPLADRMLAADPKLKAEFKAKVAADPKFAADPDARLSWFYARTPYFDDRYLLYPVGREVE
jgi:zinc carboxypeptidase